MSELDHRGILTRLFLALRAHGFVLGIRELLDGVRAVEQGNRTALAQIYPAVRQLWCSDRDLELVFDLQWGAITGGALPPTVHQPAPSDSRPLNTVDPQASIERPDTERRPRPGPTGREAEPLVEAFPIYTPFASTLQEISGELDSYWPVSRRAMNYALRHLVRPVADGPSDVLDIEATVSAVAHLGYYLGPVFKRRIRNALHLVILCDQDGSMVPFHPLTRALIETAVIDGVLDAEQVEVYYYHNVPREYVYRSMHRSGPVSLDQILAHCSSDTSILLLSDVGAARGYFRRERVRETARSLSRIRRRTGLVALLNPMPARRWLGSSAEVVAHFVPSFQMDPDGLAAAADVLRGRVASQML